MRPSIIAVIAFIGLVSCQDPAGKGTTTVTVPTDEVDPTITDAPVTTSKPTVEPTTLKPTVKPTTTEPTVKPTTMKPTEAPTTQKPTTVAPTTVAPTTVAPTPAPAVPTMGNFTVLDGGEICFMATMKVLVMQNTTHYPLINGSVDKTNSKCEADQVTVWIQYLDGNSLQMTVKHNNDSYFISEMSVTAGGFTAEKSDLQQFSVPMKSYYKCMADSTVDLGENNIKVLFSDMRYQAFQKEKNAAFVGAEDVCLGDHQSDVVIILIGSALTVLIVVILVAYLIARRRNRQRGYQSV